MRLTFSASNKKMLAAAFIAAGVTLLVYFPVLQHDFVNWDDNLYVYDNPYIQSTGGKFIKWAFMSFHASNWHPITWFSHAADYAFWELDPAGHHLTSIILHGLNTFLVVMLTVRLINYSTSEYGPSLVSGKNKQYDINPIIAGAAAGFLFGLHPLHVESVAWISERKDVLCAFFFLLSIMSYIGYVSASVKKQKNLNYCLCLLFFALSLMSKPMAVTLPAVFILLDFYPFERAFIKDVSGMLRIVFLEKVPFWGLSIASSIITIKAQQAGGSITPLAESLLGDRVLIAVQALGFYIVKILWPSDLYPFYPYPDKVSFFTWQSMSSFILISAVTLFCICSWKKQKIFFIAWAYFLVTLLPVLGIIRVGEQFAADRYTYLPSLGPLILVSLGIVVIYRNITKKHKVYAANIFLLFPALLFAVILSILSLQQAKIWKDSLTLWNFEMMKFPDNQRVRYSLGLAFWNNGFIDEAIKEYKIAAGLKPDNPNVHYDLALAYYSRGNVEMSIRHYEIAVKLNPDDLDAHNNLGIAYKSLGLFDKAIGQFRSAIKINPDYSYSYNNLGRVYELQGLLDKAIKNYKKAAILRPEWQIPRLNLERTYARKQVEKRHEEQRKN